MSPICPVESISTCPRGRKPPPTKGWQSPVSAYQEFFFGVHQVEVNPSLLSFDPSWLLNLSTISGRVPEHLLPKLKVQLHPQISGFLYLGVSVRAPVPPWLCAAQEC